MTRISALTALTSADAGDTLPILDVSATTTKKITKTAYLSDVIDGTLLGDNTITSEKLKSTVAFSAVSTASVTASSTPTKIQLASEIFDEGGDFDSTTNYRFTAPYAGIYHFDARVTLTTPGDGNLCIGYLYKNGSAFTEVINEGVNVGGVNSPNLMFGATVKLAANDYVEVYVSRSTGSGNAQGMFSGHLVGRT